MAMEENAAASFTGLIDLLAESLGGRALYASDEFFAGKENLVKPGRGVFIPGKFTERGKWMDGWESRRKRSHGYDYCVLALGVPGRVLGFDIDTHHFLGNHPPFASVDGVLAAPGCSAAELEAAPWRELLPQSPLRPGSQNLFAAQSVGPVSYLRLNIFPDGGVARFRAYGRVEPQWKREQFDAETASHVAPEYVDLAALENGAIALACSDAFFSPMNNLLLPGRSENMGGGWETRRKRHPGHDWILLQLGARGMPRVLEVDTQHFKGNHPAGCSLELIDAAAARITDLIATADWLPLLHESELSPDHRHFFQVSPPKPGIASHVRLNIFPDGGVSRLRVWGELRDEE